MMSKKNEYSTFFCLIMIFMLGWLFLDFRGTIMTGETLLLRLPGTVTFQQSPILFVVLLLAKAVLTAYSSLYIAFYIRSVFLRLYKEMSIKKKKSWCPNSVKERNSIDKEKDATK